MKPVRALILLFFPAVVFAQTPTVAGQQQTDTESGVFTNLGVFTNTQMNEYVQSLVNGCTPAADLNQGTGNFATDAIAGCLSMPASATVHQGSAIAGYADTLCNSAERTICNTAAGYFSAMARGKNSAAWGLNPIVNDYPGSTGTHLVSEEADVGVNGSPEFVRGLAVLLGGYGKMPPGLASIGLEINEGQGGGTGTLEWGTGLLISNLIPATVTTTRFAPPTRYLNEYWNGSKSAMDELDFSVNGGRGANPFMNYVWSHPSGTPGATVAGFQVPLTFGLFSTMGKAVTFPLSKPTATFEKTISVPNGNSNSDTMVLAAEPQSLSNKSLTAPLASGTGLQLFNTRVTCTTGSSLGATCTTAAINLPVPEADTDYRVVCIGKGVTNVPVVVATTNSSRTQFTITIAALTPAAASFNSFDCFIGHN